MIDALVFLLFLVPGDPLTCFHMQIFHAFPLTTAAMMAYI
jgi:hypothetical protein